MSLKLKTYFRVNNGEIRVLESRHANQASYSVYIVFNYNVMIVLIAPIIPILIGLFMINMYIIFYNFKHRKFILNQLFWGQHAVAGTFQEFRETIILLILCHYITTFFLLQAAAILTSGKSASKSGSSKVDKLAKLLKLKITATTTTVSSILSPSTELK